MVIIIFCFTMVIMWLALAATYGVGAVHNGRYTLGIVLPAKVQQSEAVQEILHQYIIKKRILHLIGFAFIGLSYLMKDYISVLLVYVFTWFFVLLLIYTKLLKKYAWKLYELKKKNGWLALTIAEKEAGMKDDEDIYWLKGKKNPSQKAGMQEKRVGFGLEYNGSNKWNFVVIAVVSICVLGLAMFLLKFDLAKVTMEKYGDKISIEAADMGVTFSLSSVKEVTLLKDCPSMSKKHGYNGSKFNFGTFRVSGMGTCEVYVYTHLDQAIEVTTEQNIILFNMESQEETLEAYHQLKDWYKKR